MIEDVVSADRRVRITLDPLTGQKKTTRKVTRRFNFETPARTAARQKYAEKRRQAQIESGQGTSTNVQ